MRKKIIAVVVAAAVACPLTGCAFTEAKTENTKYTIDASLDEGYTLKASVTCDYVNNTDVPQDELWFHLYPNAYREGAEYCPVAQNEIQTAFPNGRSYSVLDVKKVEAAGTEKEVNISGADKNILVVELPAPIDPSEHTTVKIEYSVKLPNVAHRFGYTERSVNLCNFYPIACVYENGAFVADPYYSTGDPFYSECADYEVKLTVPEKYKGAFTGVVTASDSKDGVTTYSVSANNVRDFGAVFGEFQKASGLAGTTIVNYYYYADNEPERALGAAIDAVKTFGDMFGEYPYAEYTVVQTSFLHGGMEYPALSLISDKYTGDSYLDIIVHETAHQWWYGAVGNNEVKNAWLDEAMAEYSTMMFYEKNEGYNYKFNGKRADALSAYVLYCETYKNNGLGDTSMTRAVNEYSDSIEYSYMTYVKGALMLDDVRNAVGSDAFIAGLKDYYATNKFAIAEPGDLVGAIEKASRVRVSELFDSWLNGGVKLYSN